MSQRASEKGNVFMMYVWGLRIRLFRLTVDGAVCGGRSGDSNNLPLVVVIQVILHSTKKKLPSKQVRSFSKNHRGEQCRLGKLIISLGAIRTLNCVGQLGIHPLQSIQGCGYLFHLVSHGSLPPVGHDRDCPTIADDIKSDNGRQEGDSEREVVVGEGCG